MTSKALDVESLRELQRLLRDLDHVPPPGRTAITMATDIRRGFVSARSPSVLG
ncbi:MAG: hypothetical protein ACKVPX_17685 [Myxococcaceae bacterium]